MSHTQDTDYTSDAELSRDVAIAAGQLLVDLRESYGPIDPEDKDRANALRKEADRTSNDLILERMRAARPNDAFLSEEAKDDLIRLDADRVWIIDPLDGTFEYGQGRVDFAVHIVLWVRDPSSVTGGRLEASTVELPAQHLTRTVLDAPLSLGGLPTDRPIRIVASRSRPPKTLGRTKDILLEKLQAQGLAEHGIEVIDVGSVGAKVNEILLGRADAYVHDTGFYEWDVAAPLRIAQLHGLVVGHVDQQPIAFNNESPYVTSLRVSHPDLAGLLDESLAQSRDEAHSA